MTNSTPKSFWNDLGKVKLALTVLFTGVIAMIFGSYKLYSFLAG